MQYRQAQTEEATSSINRFIRTYPTHRHIDYAYYLKALINFERNAGIILRITGLSVRGLHFWHKVGAIFAFPTGGAFGVVPGDRADRHRRNKTHHIDSDKGHRKSLADPRQF